MGSIAALLPSRPAGAGWLLAFVLLAPVDAIGADPVPAPPPRTIADLTRLLDQYKPDPTEVEKARSLVRSDAPRTGDERALVDFYLQRGQAAWKLGDARQAIADFKAAKDRLAPSDPKRLQATAFLLNASSIGGGVSESLELADEITRLPVAQPGWVLYANATAVGLYGSAGDFAAARAALARAESAYARLQLSRYEGPMRDSWEFQIQRARGFVQRIEGRFPDAEVTARRELRAVEALLRDFRDSPMPIDTWRRAREYSLLRLALSLWALGRLAEAELASREAVKAVLERAGRYSPDTAYHLQLLAQILIAQGRFADGAVIAREAVRSVAQSGASDDSRVLEVARRSLIAALVARGEYVAAVEVLEAHRSAVHKDPVLAGALGVGDIDWVIALVGARRHEEARALAASMVQWGQTQLRPDDVRLMWRYALHGVALAALGQRDLALAEFRVSIPSLLEQARVAIAADSGDVRQQQRLAIVLNAYIALLGELDASGRREAGFDPVAESFRMADAARASAVQSALSAASARASARDPALAELARREQDARWRIQSLTEVLTRLAAAPPDKQLPKIMGELARDIEALSKTRAGLRRELGERFPDYADLIDPRPASVDQVQRALRAGESLVSFYVSERTTFVWAVPKSGPAKLLRAEVSAVELQQMVARLRGALDPGVARVEDLPAFDVALAAKLYQLLLRPVESVLKDSAVVFVVPHGPVAQLPLGVLATGEPPAGSETILFDRYRNVPWLARQVTLAQLPSAATLTTLRRLPALGAGQRSFVGFGDPVFDRSPAGSAAARTSLELRSMPKLDQVDSAALAALPRLPDTADELAAVAKALGADATKDVFLREAASESTVLRLNLSGVRIISFATHGLVPGDLNGLTQPALALSAPEVAGGDGDGLLAMDEILGLKLNAEWVVLSACNTAAGQGAGAEAVSGLGRAFFYAGARALLVSNWPVETRSARELMVGVFERYAKDPSQRKAAALREAMLAMIDGEGYRDLASGKPLYRYAHPLFWAPFVVVGD